MKWLFVAFVALYLAALALFLIGTFGWFGQDTGSLAGVYLIPLGLPWNLLADRLGIAGVLPGVLAPAVNAGILFGLWQYRRSAS